MLFTRVVSLIWGMTALAGSAITYASNLEIVWLNYFIIPFALLGVIPGILAIRRNPGNKSMAVTGIVLCGTAVLFSIARFSVGFGIL